jgi:uncharacterized peroxidase-related enzyme
VVGKLTGTAHIDPLDDAELGDVEDIIEASRQASGYVPTSLRLMARKPAILRNFSALFGSVMRAPSDIPMETKWLLAHAVSSSAGCRYCQAHTAANGHKAGLATEKVQALLQFESSDVYDGAEKSIIAFGLAAGQVPNGVEAEHFDALRAFFDDDQIVELVSVVSIFGWLNRWNDTFASDLEDSPFTFAESNLRDSGWRAEKHRGPSE